MSTPIYLLVLGKGFTEAWYQLSKAEQDDLWARWRKLSNAQAPTGRSSAIRGGPMNRYSTGACSNIPILMHIDQRLPNWRN